MIGAAGVGPGARHAGVWRMCTVRDDVDAVTTQFVSEVQTPRGEVRVFAWMCYIVVVILQRAGRLHKTGPYLASTAEVFAV